MSRRVIPFARALVSGIALCLALPASAGELQPHLARYQIHLGLNPNAPIVGNATHRLSHDCQQWHLDREVKVELNLTTNLRLQLESRLKARESRSGDSFTYELLRVRNDSRQQIFGTVTALREGPA